MLATVIRFIFYAACGVVTGVLITLTVTADLSPASTAVLGAVVAFVIVTLWLMVYDEWRKGRL